MYVKKYKHAAFTYVKWLMANFKKSHFCLTLFFIYVLLSKNIFFTVWKSVLAKKKEKRTVIYPVGFNLILILYINFAVDSIWNTQIPL